MRYRVGRPLFLAALAAVGLVPPAAPATAAGPSAPVVCALIDIHEMGPFGLAELWAVPGLARRVEADRDFLACGAPEAVARLDGPFRVVARYERVAVDRLFLLLRAHRDDLALPGVRALAMGGRFAVVEVTPGADLAAPWHPWHAARAGDPGPQTVGAALTPLAGDLVLARQAANAPAQPRRAALGPVQLLADEVDSARWFADVTTLAGFNRHTHGTGIAAARDWLVAQFQAMTGLTVETPPFLVQGTTAHNVVATLPGTIRPDDWYLIGGHYDSRTQFLGDSTTHAPGAEDNGSGCAGVLEVARILTAHPPEATLKFICFSGEEEGLYGSVDLSQDLVEAGQAARVRGMFNLDMIGFTADSDLDALLEAEPEGQPLVTALAAAAAELTSLRIVIEVCNGCAWGSDHVPFSDRGMPSVLTIENDWNVYPHYHKVTDLPEHLSQTMGGEILRMNVGALADLAGAGAALFSDGFESGDTSRWSAAIP